MNKILYGVLSWWEIIQTCPISRQELLMKFSLNLFFIWFFVVFTKPPILVNEILRSDSHPVHLFLQRSFSSYMQKTCDVAILATKKIAEKVRKSRQNVNRNKSAWIVKIDKKWWKSTTNGENRQKMVLLPSKMVLLPSKMVLPPSKMVLPPS